MRGWLWMCGCVLVLTQASAQMVAQEPEKPQEAVAAPSGPTLQFRGFADINFAATDDRRSDDGRTGDGFSLGNLVGHVSSSLGGKFSFYAEVIVQPQVGGGFAVDLARSILRYDYNDRFKISVGRYHAPVGYWNTAFHRGLWLQTTIFRPDMVREEFLQPDHFMGVFTEGVLSRTAGVGYIVGFGNGREGDLQLYCRTKDCSTLHRAGVGRLFVRPPQLANVEFGGAVYRDTIVAADPRGLVEHINFPELITSAYVAVTRESPEVIAEFSNVRHHDRGDGANYNTQAMYLQVAYRLPKQDKWKPYARFEKAISPGRDEPVTGDLDNWKALAGIRYELTETATFKIEYGHRRRPGSGQDGPRVNGLFMQTAFTF